MSMWQRPMPTVWRGRPHSCDRAVSGGVSPTRTRAAAGPARPARPPPRPLGAPTASVRLSAADARVPVSARLRTDNLTNVEDEGIFGFPAPGRALPLGVALRP